VRIETKAASEMSSFEKARTECVVTSSLYAYQIGTKWAEVDWTVMVWEEDELVSNIHIIDRIASVGGIQLHLGGLGNIATKVEWRKRGYASAALKVAQEFLSDPLKVDFGLITCYPWLVEYYERTGWRIVADKLFMDQPDGKKTIKLPIMALPVTRNKWPKGEIDLCGLPW
jgi:predicted acetyltransferase